MKKEETKTLVTYDFENGEVVHIFKESGMWEYVDEESTQGNCGCFVYSYDTKTAYILCSTYRIEAAVIQAMRDQYGACEWVEPKLKRPRKNRKV